MNVPASPPARDHILRSILAILFSVACFSVLNAISTTLTQHYPVVQVIWARYVFAFVFMMALFLPRSGLALFRWHNVGSQVVRGLLLFFSSFLYFHGIVYLPLATAASISLTSPLIVTALSARFLGEPVGVRRWIAVCIGFAGALIVVLLSLALGVLWAGIMGVIAIALGMAITLAAIGMASMVAHRLIIGDGRSREIGRFTTIAASLIVIATAGTLLLGAVERFIR